MHSLRRGCTVKLAGFGASRVRLNFHLSVFLVCFFFFFRAEGEEEELTEAETNFFSRTQFFTSLFLSSCRSGGLSALNSVDGSFYLDVYKSQRVYVVRKYTGK